jgi:hypothetical protein
MNNLDTIPQSIYATSQLSESLNYPVLNDVLAQELLVDYGYVATLLPDYESSVALADEAFFMNQIGYVLAFDPTKNTFVAFTEPREIRFMELDSEAVFDSIVDEANSQPHTTVTIADGVARIESLNNVTVAILSGE